MGEGLAVLCDVRGLVRESLRGTIPQGGSILDLVSKRALPQMHSLLSEALRHGAACNWPLEVQDGPWGYAGAAVSEDNLLFAFGRSPELLCALVGELSSSRGPGQALAVALLRGVGPDEDPHTELARITSEIVNLQREEAKRSALLARLNQEKNAWMGMVAHDLRNPLQVIDMSLQTLLSDGLSPERRRLLIERARGNVIRMLELIGDLLDFAAVEAGTLRLAPTRTDPVRLVRETLEPVAAAARVRGVRLVEELEDGGEVVLDPGRFEQVVQNLAGNAVKFSPSGSQVTVRLWKEGDHLSLSVHDQGPGIPPEQIERLFRPFERESSADAKGTGLGLAIVRRIVTAHGGAVHVRSTPGEGSTFQVTLPTKWAPPPLASNGR